MENKCKKCGQVLSEEDKVCPKCGKKVKRPKLFTFFLKMLLVFILLFELVGVFGGGEIIDSLEYYKYGSDFIGEIIIGGIVLIILLLFGNSYVFKEKREKFFKSLLTGWPMLLIGVICLVDSIITVAKHGIDYHIVLNLALYCFAIGVLEELLCRGWLLNEFLERFNKNKKQVVMSLCLSALIFGVMHITNVLDPAQNLFETLLQILQATSAGFFLGSIYYKTKNIWAVVAIHAFYDFSIFLGESIYLRDCATGTYNTAATIVNILNSVVIIAIYVIGSILVLRSKNGTKLPGDVKENKVQNNILAAVAVTLIVVCVIPMDFIPGMDQTTVCYDYPVKKVKDGYTKEYTFFYNPRYELVNNQTKDKIIIDQSLHTLKTSLSDSNGNKVALEDLFNGKMVFDLYVYENETYYGILMYGYLDAGQLYYAEVNKNEIVDSVDFLNELKGKFKEYLLPPIDEIGAITFNGTTEKRPYIKTKTKDVFTIENSVEYFLDIEETE